MEVMEKLRVPQGGKDLFPVTQNAISWAAGQDMRWAMFSNTGSWNKSKEISKA